MQSEHAPTVAITETTMKELAAMRFAFAGNLMPDDEAEAYDDELIAMMLGYELRRLAKPQRDLKQFIQLEVTARMELLKRSPAVARWTRPRRSGVIPGVSRPGFLLDARGLDADTLVVLNARAAMVADFVELAGHVLRSPAVPTKRNAIFALLRQLSDQQIIDLVIWANLAQFDDDDLANDYPMHIEDEINDRVDGELVVVHQPPTCAGWLER